MQKQIREAVTDMLLYPVRQLAVSMRIMRKSTNVCGGVNDSVCNQSAGRGLGIMIDTPHEAGSVEGSKPSTKYHNVLKHSVVNVS